MKKLTLLALITLIMAGCNNTAENMEAPIGGNVFTTAYQTITIDSCEYVNGGYRLAHKGNCRFCAERRKQELQTIVKQLKGK